MSDETGVGVTLKAGPGYDAPWVVIRESNIEETKLRVQEFINSGLAALVGQAAEVLAGGNAAAKSLGATVVSHEAQDAPTAPPAPEPTPAPAAPAAAPTGTATTTDQWGNVYTHNVPGAPSCPHGTMVLKAGTRKDGKPFKAYVCPVPVANYRNKTDCKPSYVN